MKTKKLKKFQKQVNADGQQILDENKKLRDELEKFKQLSTSLTKGYKLINLYLFYIYIYIIHLI